MIETLGKYTKTVNSGLTFLIPGVQTLRRVDIREQVVNVPEQQIITMDNVSMAFDGIIYVQITDPFQATYDVNNVFMAVVSLAQTSLRSVLGTMSLDETLSNRDTINARLLTSLDKETGKWGVKVLRVEIKRLDPPDDIQDAMSKPKFLKQKAIVSLKLLVLKVISSQLFCRRKDKNRRPFCRRKVMLVQKLLLLKPRLKLWNLNLLRLFNFSTEQR